MNAKSRSGDTVNASYGAIEVPQVLRYWPAVDGLRVVAVGAVLLFHLDRSSLPGGFVGVDIFFVISGFLISAVLLNDIDLGKFSLLRFYQRRIARIAPAFLVVLAVTLLVAWKTYSAQDFASTSASAVYTAASLANIKYMLMGSYFRISPDSQPLLHYWSLAVEEQFYLIFPFVLLGIVRWIRRPLAVMTAALLFSLALCCVITVINHAYAFYLLPTRAWELLAGVCLTLIRWRGIKVAQAWVSRCNWTGVTFLVLSLFVIREGPHFPGFAAILPVLGTALLLVTLDWPSSSVHRFLASPLMVHIGKRSYSLYLWHWPIYCFVDYRWFVEPYWFRFLVKVVTTLALSWVTYEYIERPARRLLGLPKNAWIAFAGFLGAAASIAAVGYVSRSSSYLDATRESLKFGGIHAVTGSRGRIALIGDSQASIYAAALAREARKMDYDLHALGESGSNQLPGEDNSAWPSVASYLDRDRPQIVIIAQAWDSKLGADAASLRAAIDFIRRRGGRIIVIAQPPQADEPNSRKGIREGSHPPFWEAANDRKARLLALSRLRGLIFAGVEVIDAAPLLTAPDGGIKLIGNNGRLTYQDLGHLSDTGVDLVIPSIDAAIARALPSRPQRLNEQ
jgi:peptidoglycan/LPS O-acetylase OafA/YrhL